LIRLYRGPRSHSFGGSCAGCAVDVLEKILDGSLGDGTVLPFVHRKLEAAKPTILPNTRFCSIKEQSVTLENVLNSTQTVIPDVGILVVAGHRQAHTSSTTPFLNFERCLIYKEKPHDLI
jgi:hypothetical protein